MVKYGKYTLVFYTMSFVLNALLAKIMWRVGYILSTGILDIISCVISIIMYYCPLNFDFLSRVYAHKKNWADSPARVSPFGYLCSFQTQTITKSWAKVHIFSDSRYWVSC